MDNKGKGKVTNEMVELFKEGYEILEDVHLDISMLEENDDQSNNNNNEGNTTAAARISSRQNSQNRPCPFVLKIYEMLADNQLKPLISWSNNGTSFIINDHHQFAAQVLPRFFRHNNISSFICQLNCYGFRKISWDRFEFQHEWFQKGKGQWLKNIKRKNSKKPQEQGDGQQEKKGTIDEMAASRMEKEMEEMREEQVEMKEQIMEMQQQLDLFEKEITKQAGNNKKAKMLMFLESLFECKEKQSCETELKDKKSVTGFESDSNLGKLLMDEMNTNNWLKNNPIISPSRRRWLKVHLCGVIMSALVAYTLRIRNSTEC